MKGTSCFRCGALLLFCLLAITMWAQAPQPSLADVARQKPAAKAKRVVTNDEIPPSPEADKPPSSGSALAADAPKDATAARRTDAKSAVPPEKQAKLQELLTERGKLQKVLAAMQAKLDESGNDEQRRVVLSEVVQHTRQQVEENQKQIDQLQAGGGKANAPADKSVPPVAPPK